MIVGAALAIIFVAALVFLSTAEAGQNLGTPGNKHYNNQPNHSDGIGNCNSDGSFCWSIEIDNGYHNPERPYPGQVHGYQAKRMITHGQINYANLNSWGIMQLGVYNRGWSWKCEIDLRSQRPQYRCTAQ